MHLGTYLMLKTSQSLIFSWYEICERNFVMLQINKLWENPKTLKLHWRYATWLVMVSDRAFIFPSAGSQRISSLISPHTPLEPGWRLPKTYFERIGWSQDHPAIKPQRLLDLVMRRNNYPQPRLASFNKRSQRKGQNEGDREIQTLGRGFHSSSGLSVFICR
jgi:hypothetical protein